MVEFGSFDAIRRIKDTHTASRFVWPDEGEFTASEFKFNVKHKRYFEPLWVDATTANLMVKVHDAVNEADQIKFRKMIAQGRGEFAAMVEFCWGVVKHG